MFRLTLKFGLHRVSRMDQRRKSSTPCTEKIFPKNNFCKEVQLYFETSLTSFIHKIFEQVFHQYVTFYSVRIWTYKNVDEKTHTFSWRGKNGQKGFFFCVGCEISVELQSKRKTFFSFEAPLACRLSLQ